MVVRPVRNSFLATMLIGLLLSHYSLAQDDSLAQEGADDKSKPKKIAFIAGNPSHGYGAHEHYAGCVLLAKYLQKNMGYDTTVYKNGWPEEGAAAFDGVDAVVVYCDGGGGHLLNSHIDEFDAVMKKGIGLACLHYGVETVKGKEGQAFLDWIGGYFETNWSVNPHWTAQFKSFPDHPISKGVKPFEINDEWYFHMRFRPDMKGVTPILSAYPPKSTMQRPDGAHSGNPQVRQSVAKGEIQHVAWAAERENDGRGFGFTGGHVHWNWGDDNFRKVVLNAIVWIAHGKVPENGVGGETPSQEELEQNQDFPKPEKKKAISLIEPNLRTVAVHTSTGRDPAEAVSNLKVHPELKATLFGSEPLLLSPSNIDIDAKGRVWVCEIVNYRQHKGERPEGDRILILEDTDGDGKLDNRKVFYQGTDIDSPHGVCVLGNNVFVSAGENVLVFDDENGDDVADGKRVLFTGISGTQHDHGIHVFAFGPDGKLYFNFGNEGKQLKYPSGEYVVDKAGNQVRESRKPYQQGMVFRCNFDGSELETLGWNFRNNWMVAVDSFGTIWQSDNDDDGNRSVRVNYVMEFGNYGYRDEMTGAGWQAARTGMHPEISYRHWHQNDPGVVPNLLATGAGSPTGITVYEGNLLPKTFRNEMFHCDAGPSITRCYPVKESGAGYTATVINILEGAGDQWFRPSDVKVAPDGSLVVADWYDPGVGGHAMGDLNKGRIFRVLPKDDNGRYAIPSFDYSSVDGAVQALVNPCNSVRYLAWTALHSMGAAAEPALQKLWQHENPRMRARALWVLGKMHGGGEKYVAEAIVDDDPNIRITGLRLARQIDDVDEVDIVERLFKDPSPQVRRECLIAIRHTQNERTAKIWAQLAMQHDGNDRWYLEALGIGAELHWDECFAAWKSMAGDDWKKTKAGRDIVWRSRAEATPKLLAEIIINSNPNANELNKYFRAFDFLSGESKDQAITHLALAELPGPEANRTLIIQEAFNRIENIDLSDPANRQALERALNASVGTPQFVNLVSRFNIAERFPSLVDLAKSKPNESVGIDSIRALISKNQTRLILNGLKSGSMEDSEKLLTALGNSADNRAASVLKEVFTDENLPLEQRRQAVRQMGNIRDGANELLRQAKDGKIENDFKDAVAAALLTSNVRDIARQAAEIYPAGQSKDENPLPPLPELAKREGDANKGNEVFVKSGTCAKCHKVNGQGDEIGPDLTEIGSKLSRQSMYESIVYPSAGISHNYETYTVALDDGNVVSGLMLSQTDDMVVIKNKDGVVRNIKKSEIGELNKSPVSLMPADLFKLISEQELVDVVEYLTTLKK